MSSAASTIHVAGPSPYDVVVGHDLGDRLPGLLGADVRRVALIFDGNIAALAAGPRARLLDAGYAVTDVALMPAGEQAKTFGTVGYCWERLGDEGFTRSDAVVTVGGGATTDLGGFVAATWLRGVRVVHLPTTLLGMVDAAVGGKTGVNSPAGKNLVGAFHEPAGVLCDLATLATLPEPELVSGLAEVIKCGFIADPSILDDVYADPASARDRGSPLVRTLVERAVRVKADVVAGDLRETGANGGVGRELLNYGHTLAHAIERRTDYAVRHGEAVAVGMVYVAELARRTGRLDEDTVVRHREVLGSVGLPVALADLGVGQLAFDDLMATMRVDKKARGDQLRFVVLDGLARASVLAGPDEDDLRASYAAIGGTP